MSLSPAAIERINQGMDDAVDAATLLKSLETARKLREAAKVLRKCAPHVSPLLLGEAMDMAGVLSALADEMGR